MGDRTMDGRWIGSVMGHKYGVEVDQDGEAYKWHAWGPIAGDSARGVEDSGRHAWSAAFAALQAMLRELEYQMEGARRCVAKWGPGQPPAPTSAPTCEFELGPGPEHSWRCAIHHIDIRGVVPLLCPEGNRRDRKHGGGECS